MLSRVALRSLMGKAASAGSLQAVYETALRCVQEALEVERAALLVLDESRKMRFVAWSDLSASYRSAVDGHSPWSAAETSATPLLVADVEAEASLAVYRDALRREDIRALAFFPVQFGSKLLGKFMLYYREPNVPSDGEVAIAQQIADYVAFALEHHRLSVEIETRLGAEREQRQRAEIEAALRQANESRLHLALATGLMGAWDWDIATGRVSWSAQLEALHGLMPGTFAGTIDAVRSDAYPADVARLEAAIAAALAAPDSGYDIEYRIVRSDGALRWLAASGRVLVDAEGRPARMVGICRDVTERKRADEITVLLADVSRSLASSLDPAAALRQLAERVVPTFADYCVTYGASENGIEALGFAHRDPAKTALVEALARDVPVSLDDRRGPGMVIRRGEPCLAKHIAFDAAADPPPPDDVQWVLEPRSVMIVPLNARGRTLGAIAFAATDDSGRRFAEADLGIGMALASRAALLVDNARLYAEARTAVKARDDMIAVVSHDLRDPLQSIAAAAALLRSEPLSQDNAESVETIAVASHQMQMLVQDLLDISQLDAGEAPVERDSVGVADLVAEAYRLFLPQAEAKGLRLERQVGANLPPVAVDRHRIMQVLSNLIGNAFKFVAAGGVVTVAAERQHEHIRITVEDTGVGIPEENLQQVFERFWCTDRRAGGGAGLGLAVAKSIVEAHGGSIGVSSRVGAGSTFHFTVPVHPACLGRGTSEPWIPVDGQAFPV